MAKPFDAALKELITRHPYDWARQVGLPESVTLRVVDSELSTVTAAADRVILVDAPLPCILDVELQASYDARIESRLLKYSALLVDRFDLPVHTVLILLRPEANSPHLAGRQIWRSPYGTSSNSLEYNVIRLWETPLDVILAGGPGVLPLAPLARDADKVLPKVVRELDQRFGATLPPSDAAEMWAATYTLMGLRYPEEMAMALLRGVRQMRESSTYQAILEEGRQEGRQEGLELGLQELRRVLLLQGTRLFGTPSADVVAHLEAESGIERLEELAERIVQVKSWEQLFA